MDDFLDIPAFVAQLDRTAGDEYYGTPTEHEPDEDE